jgi:hypothetical protein
MSEAMIWNTIAGVLTLAIFSFLYRDNPFYKMAEYLFVGVSAGYYFSQQYHQVFRPNLFDPLAASLTGSGPAGGFWLLVPFTLGVLMFTRFVPSWSWLSRWPIALMVGTFSGLAIIGTAQGDLVAQIQASMIDLGAGGAGAAVSNVILLVGLVATLLYFFFSKEHTGALGAASRLGIAFLMISFGASYGFTVMARISLLVGRLQFLYEDWPKSIVEALR